MKEDLTRAFELGLKHFLKFHYQQFANGIALGTYKRVPPTAEKLQVMRQWNFDLNLNSVVFDPPPGKLNIFRGHHQDVTVRYGGHLGRS